MAFAFVDSPVNLTCSLCGQKVSVEAEGWADHPLVRGWCRFQLAQDHGLETPWFCCEDDLIEWLTRKLGRLETRMNTQEHIAESTIASARAAEEAHRERIHAEIESDLGCLPLLPSAIVDMITAGRIRHLTIQY